MDSDKRTVAEFFAGIGLMRMGLAKAGWRVTFANDIDAEKETMYRDHFGGDGEFKLADIHRISPRQVPEVALATASFPCNDLSVAGGRKGLAGRHSSAFWGFATTLKHLGKRRPPLVLLENVPGFLTSRQGEDLHAALMALNRIGYAMDAFFVDAVLFVPQSRKRLFVVGTQRSHLSSQRGSAALREVPESEFRPEKLLQFIREHPEIEWNIRSMPSPPRNTNRLERLLEELPPESKEWWSEERCQYLLNQMSPRHRAEIEQMIQDKRVRFGTVFRRVRVGRSMAELRTDGIAGCLRTPRGGSGRQILVAAGQGRFAARLLTPRECARLMGADDFVIKVPSNKALFGFGDAVCVPVIEWIARNYLNLAWEELARR